MGLWCVHIEHLKNKNQLSSVFFNTCPPSLPEQKTQTWYKTGCMGTVLCTLDTCNQRTRGPNDVPIWARTHSNPKGITIKIWNHLNGHYCEFPFGDVGSKVLSGYGH